MLGSSLREAQKLGPDERRHKAASLTAREVADYLGLSPEMILRRYRAGEIPGYRIATNALRFRESDIEAWLDRRRVAPSGTEAHTATHER